MTKMSKLGVPLRPTIPVCPVPPPGEDVVNMKSFPVHSTDESRSKFGHLTFQSVCVCVHDIVVGLNVW